MCFMKVLNKTLIYGNSSREGPMPNVYPGSLKQNWTSRLRENAELNTEKIHHHVVQFVDGTRNLWR